MTKRRARIFLPLILTPILLLPATAAGAAVEEKPATSPPGSASADATTAEPSVAASQATLDTQTQKAKKKAAAKKKQQAEKKKKKKAAAQAAAAQQAAVAAAAAAPPPPMVIPDTAAIAAQRALVAQAQAAHDAAATKAKETSATALAAEQVYKGAVERARAAQTHIDTFARHMYMSGGSDPAILSTVALINDGDPTSVAIGPTTVDSIAATQGAKLDSATTAVNVTKTILADSVKARELAAEAVAVAAQTMRTLSQLQAPPGLVVSGYDEYASVFEYLLGASTMTWWDGTTGSVSGMCLKNAESAWTMLGGSNSEGMFYDAVSAGRAYEREGKLVPYVAGQVVPRGMLIFWDERVGSGFGHVAVADGNGNFINNFGSDTIVSTPTSSATDGIIGWGPPTVFGAAP